MRSFSHSQTAGVHDNSPRSKVLSRGNDGWAQIWVINIRQLAHEKVSRGPFRSRELRTRTALARCASSTQAWVPLPLAELFTHTRPEGSTSTTCGCACCPTEPSHTWRRRPVWPHAARTGPEECRVKPRQSARTRYSRPGPALSLCAVRHVQYRRAGAITSVQPKPCRDRPVLLAVPVHRVLRRPLAHARAPRFS